MTPGGGEAGQLISLCCGGCNREQGRGAGLGRGFLHCTRGEAVALRRDLLAGVGSDGLFLCLTARNSLGFHR